MFSAIDPAFTGVFTVTRQLADLRERGRKTPCCFCFRWRCFPRTSSWTSCRPSGSDGNDQGWDSPPSEPIRLRDLPERLHFLPDFCRSSLTGWACALPRRFPARLRQALINWYAVTEAFRPALQTWFTENHHIPIFDELGVSRSTRGCRLQPSSPQSVSWYSAAASKWRASRFRAV